MIKQPGFCLILLAVLFLNIQSQAEDLMGNAGFAALVQAIANLNRAMRDAAENPMDKWRRQNVRHAISVLPGAIEGLAQEFLALRISPRQFPMIQRMLGGFVDVNAADNYNKFLRTLDKSFIPEVGPNFPQSVANGSPGASRSLTYNEDAPMRKE